MSTSTESPRPPIDRVLLDAKQVARILSVSKRTLHRLVSRGDFPPPIKLGACTRWRREDVLRWVEER